MPKHLKVTEFEFRSLLSRLEQAIDYADAADCEDYLKSVKQDCRSVVRAADRNNIPINKRIADVANGKRF